jgi:hypothetical protein
MSSGIGIEWSPALGALWQVVQVPVRVSMPRSSFRPLTPRMAMGLPLKSACPRAMARRATVLLKLRTASVAISGAAATPLHASYSVIAVGVNGACVW